MINPIYSPDPERYNDRMQYRRCGKSGILLPAISSDIRERHTDARIHGVDKELGGFVVEVNADSTEWDMYYTTEGEFSHESKDTPDYD